MPTTQTLERKFCSKNNPAPQTPDISVSTRGSWCLLGLFAFSGLVSLSSEILWTRVLVIPLGSSLYSFALILAAFLFGIALGSLAADRLFKGHSRIKTFLILEGGLGLIGLMMIPLLDQITPLTSWLDAHFYDSENTALQTLALRSAVAFLLMFPPAFGFGLVFPIANQIHLSLFQNVPTTLGGSYTVNTLGAILGTVLTPFVFIPIWGIERSLFILFGSLLLLASLVPFFIQENKKGHDSCLFCPLLFSVWDTRFSSRASPLTSWERVTCRGLITVHHRVN